MKIKSIFFIFVLFSSGIFLSFTQETKEEDTKTALSAKKLTFYGINYTKFKLLGEEGFIDKTGKSKCNSLKFKYFENWNDYFLLEGKKFNTKVNFIVDDSKLDLDYTNTWNGQIDVTDCLIKTGEHSVSNTELKNIVEEYADDTKTGVGTLIVAEYISKTKKHGSYIYVYFNRNDGKILYHNKYQGAPSGMGFGVYWINSFYETLKLHKVHVKSKRKELKIK